MQKNAFSYLLGVVALSLLCSCGAGKKEEVKVDVKEQAPVEQKAEAGKEVAQTEAQPQAAAVATTENTEAAATTVAQATPVTAPVENKENKAAEENKVA